jgi:histone deacetylase 6
MPGTALVFDDRFLLHRATHEHPEHPGRLSAIWRRLETAGLVDRCVRAPAREATTEELCAVHTPRVVEMILSTHGQPPRWLDGDTFVCEDSALAARLASGMLVDVSLAIARGAFDNAMALVRPPGHHAERDRVMGFCLLNHAAVAARALLDAGAAHRVLILDWDLHHGNGTQDIFWDDPRVLYASLHQHPLYPGTGRLEDVGEGRGAGHTLNVPLPGGMGDADYLLVFDRLVLPIARAFAPDFVIVSAGFDASLGDPLGAMRLTPAGFAQMTERLCGLAHGRVALALEGGYNLGAIAAAAEACVRVLLGERAPEVDLSWTSPFATRVVEHALEIHRRFWAGI